MSIYHNLEFMEISNPSSMKLLGFWLQPVLQVVYLIFSSSAARGINWRSYSEVSLQGRAAQLMPCFSASRVLTRPKRLWNASRSLCPYLKHLCQRRPVLHSRITINKGFCMRLITFVYMCISVVPQIARLYLVSDVLYNSSAKVANASYYRKL